MFRPFAFSTALLIAAAWSASMVSAQTTSEPARSGSSLGRRLDQFGRDLMGGIFPTRSRTREAEQEQERTERTTPTAPPYVAQDAGGARTQQGLTGYAPGGLGDRPVRIVGARPDGEAENSNRPLPERMLAPSDGGGYTQRGYSRGGYSQSQGGYGQNGYTQGGYSNQPAPQGQSPYTMTNPMASSSSPTEAQPLHERLMGLRQSAFGSGPAVSDSTAGEARISSGGPAGESDVPIENDGAPTVAPRHAEVARRATSYTGPHTTDQDEDESSMVEAPRVDPGADDHLPTSSYPDAPRGGGLRSQAGAEASAPYSAAGEDLRGDDRVLFARESPILNVRTLGPRRISVGKESSYEVLVENLGEMPADNVVVLIGLPEWADVLGAEASTGATLSDRAATGSKQFRWNVGPLAGRGREKIILRIVPRQSRPIDLAVRWDFTPAASQTVIEVQEPKLALRLGGPREVFFGKKETYTLEISNSGNGPAENVILTLMPLAPGDGAPSNHSLGDLPAGQKKVLEIELVARQVGQMAVRMDVRCDGDGRAALDEKILVRKPELQLAAEGPQMQFVGTVATYQFRVRNPGNAPARNVMVTARLPIEAKFLAASHGGKPTADGAQVAWTIDRLDEGAEQMIQLKCQLVRNGFSQIEVEAASEGDLLTNAAVMTKVEAMADLALEVSDPPGPVPVGGDAVYEIRIHNRGTKRASGVEVVAYFSRGIEPVAVEGSPYSIGPGQVVFDAIGALPAGKEIVLKIKARAETPGNHMFRTEVYCKPLGTKLVGEETTHFYQGGFIAAPLKYAPNSAPSAAPSAQAPPVISDRRAAPTGPSVAPGVAPGVAPNVAPGAAVPVGPSPAPPTVTPIYSPTPAAPAGQPTLAPRRS